MTFDVALKCRKCGTTSIYALSEPLPVSLPCLAAGDAIDCTYEFTEKMIARAFAHPIDHSSG